MADQNPYRRVGNDLPPLADPATRPSIDRESILYSYNNTVETSYVGDIRLYAKKFGDYCKNKAEIYDPIRNVIETFPVRYGAPNVVFSDNKGITGNAPEASLKDRIVLPLISYYLQGMEYDSSRAIDPAVRYSYKPKKNKDESVTSPSKARVTTAPKPIKYQFQVDIWTEKREHFYQILTAFQLDFNPYSYLLDLHNYNDETEKTFYVPYAKMTLDSFSDQSNFIPGTDRRVVRGVLRVTVEGWLSQPPKDVSYLHRTNWDNSASLAGGSADFNTDLGLTLTDGVNTSVVVTSGTPNSADNITVDPIGGLPGTIDTVQDALSFLATEIQQLTLAEAMPSNCCFKIVSNQGYIVRSTDISTPIVNGITLESGGIGSTINVALVSGKEYVTPISYGTTASLYLGNNGVLTQTPPSLGAGDSYLYIIGTSIGGTNKVIFNPIIPIKLN